MAGEDMRNLLDGAGNATMTANDVHQHISAMWSGSVYKNDKWRQVYLRMLKPYNGEVLAKAFQRAVDMVNDGRPPTPQRIAYLCREVVKDRRPRPRREPEERERSKELSPAAEAEVRRKRAEIEARQEAGTATAFDGVLLNTYTKLIEAHERAVNESRP